MYRKPVDGYSSDDLFRSRLDQMINMRHELVLLADLIDWTYLDEQLTKRGRPAIPSRLMMSLHLLKSMYSLSDESVYNFRLLLKWFRRLYLRLKWLGLTPKLAVLVLRARLRAKIKTSMTISANARLAA